jgi:hypothetical protein
LRQDSAWAAPDAAKQSKIAEQSRIKVEIMTYPSETCHSFGF